VPAAGIVAEAMVALVLAEAALEKFGGDSVAETRRNVQGYLDLRRRGRPHFRELERRPRSPRSPGTTGVLALGGGAILDPGTAPAGRPPGGLPGRGPRRGRQSVGPGRRPPAAAPSIRASAGAS
jgi:hypothetical protein